MDDSGLNSERNLDVSCMDVGSVFVDNTCDIVSMNKDMVQVAGEIFII